MPSILDLVTEYSQLDKLRAERGGVLDQASEMRHQCLKFFLEFDLAAPYAAALGEHAASPAPEAVVVPIAGVQEQHYLGVHGAEDQPPGAEITGYGTAPLGVEAASPAPAQDDVPITAQELDSEIMQQPLPDEPAPAHDSPPPGQEAAPAASSGPLDMHDADLSATVDDFFSTHVDTAGPAGPIAAPEMATLDMASAQTGFPAPVAEPAPPLEPMPQEPVPAELAMVEPVLQEISTDDIESLPLDDAVAHDTPVTPHEDTPIPEPAPVAAAMEPIPELPLTFDPPAPAPVAAAVVEQAPMMTMELPASALPEPVPAPSPTATPVPLAANWEMALPPEQSGVHNAPAMAADAGPSFDLPLTFESPAPAPAPAAASFEPMPIFTPDPAPTPVAAPVPEAVSFEPLPIVAPAPVPVATAAPAFAIAESHRVTVHFLDGDVKRGVVRELGYDANDLCLFSMDEQSSDYFPVAALKAVFLILQPGAKAPDLPAGKDLNVTFKDGRALKGRSPDFTPVIKVFTLYPDPRQGNIERVVVFKEAIDEVH